MNHTLIIRHQPNGNDIGQFRVEHSKTGKLAKSTQIESPDEISVEGRPKSNLLQDLTWYLEKFLDYPFSPNTEIAERVLTALENWGEETFAVLFTGRGRDWFKDAYRDGLKNLTIKIASDDPRILAWPWEALKDPEGTTLAHSCKIERQLNELHDPPPLSQNLPTNCLNILLVIARPKEQDVGYHAISRPLVELAAEHHLPINVDVLRPPTFKQLRSTLSQKPGHYHIVHFDGHGGYGDFGHVGGAHALKGVSGKLLFENEEGKVDYVSADVLTTLLSEFNIPIMVLNACQSARIDEHADDPFASVAAALLKSGIHSVVAMGYSLYVSGAKQFVPAFYERLFVSGEVAEAVRSGRGEMLASPNRQCLVGEAVLADWMVPVLYQQDPVKLAFVQQQTEATKSSGIELPQEAALRDYGFIGRDSTILQLERRSRLQPQSAILIHGMAGVGKTTMVKGYLQWLRQTNGLTIVPFWFQFDEIRSAEFVINQLVRTLFDSNADAAPLADKVQALINALKQHPVLMIWDNFESAAGIDGTEVTPLLSNDDRELLSTLLQGLRGGKTTVLITSRSAENWLGKTQVYRLPLTGLQGEECWTYCNALVRELGLTIDRKDEAYRGIIEKLDGHPLALQAALSGLAERSPQAILDALERSFDDVDGDESTKRIFAALTVLTECFPPEFSAVLQLIGLHERFVVKNYITLMHQTALATDHSTDNTDTLINHVFAALHSSGLIHEIDQNFYAMHPALSGFIRKAFAASPNIENAFIYFMADYAEEVAPMPLHEQKLHFYFHRTNFFYALNLAKDKDVYENSAELVQSLAVFHLNNREFATATRLVEQLACLAIDNVDLEGEAAAYHQLGRILEELRIFSDAGDWYQKSLAINEKQGNVQGAAMTCHQLGVIAQKQRQFIVAGDWYHKALVFKGKQDNEQELAGTYLQLGSIAEEQRDFTAAEGLCQKALAIFGKQGNEQGAAMTYHQLGDLALGQLDFSAAGDWYQKSLAIKENQGDEEGAAITYHQLGLIALKQQNFSAAKDWYQKALVTHEKQGNKHGMASTYHQLGIIAVKQSDYRTAANLFALSTNKFMKTNDNYHLNMALVSFFLLVIEIRKDHPELERELINHFNTTNSAVLPDWTEIEKGIEQQRKETQ